MRDKPRKIKHCEIYKQSADTNIVFSIVEQFSFPFTPQQIQEQNRYVLISYLISICSLQMRVWVPCVNDEHLVMGAGHVTKRWVGALIPEMSAHFNPSFETSKSTRDCLKATNAEYFNWVC